MKVTTKKLCFAGLFTALAVVGCQLSSLIAAFLAANRDQMLEATVAAVSSMGLAGEIAHNRLTEIEGNATYRNYIIDAIYRMDGESLNKKAVYTKIL